MTEVEQEDLRDRAVSMFRNIYGGAIGAGPTAEYIGKTGIDVLKGADLLGDVAARYESPIEYADNPIAKSLRDVARIHLAGLGTRIFYANHNRL